MEDPVVILETGNSYERANIEAWLRTSMSVACVLFNNAHE